MSTATMKIEVKNVIKFNVTKSMCHRTKKVIVDEISRNHKDEWN